MSLEQAILSAIQENTRALRELAGGRGQALPGPALQHMMMLGQDETGAQKPLQLRGGGILMERKHAALTALDADDHTQYAKLAGRAYGQTFYGGVGAGEDLILRGTSHATPGRVRILRPMLDDAAANPASGGEFWRNGDNIKWYGLILRRFLAFADANPVLGNVVYHDGTDWQLLAPNTAATRKFLAMTGTGAVGAAPAWEVGDLEVTLVRNTDVIQAIGASPINHVLSWDTEDRDDASQFPAATTLTGTLQKSAASTAVVGTGTLFTTELAVGDIIRIPGTANEERRVATITDNLNLAVDANFGNNASGQTATKQPQLITIAAAGIYLVAAAMQWSDQSAVHAMYVWKNGANTAVVANNSIGEVCTAAAGVMKLAAGDTLSVNVNGPVNNSFANSVFSATLLRRV